MKAVSSEEEVERKRQQTITTTARWYDIQKLAPELYDIFGPPLAVLCWAEKHLRKTDDARDEIPCENLFRLYKTWPKRMRIPEEEFRQCLVKAGYDLFDDVVGGVALRGRLSAEEMLAE